MVAICCDVVCHSGSNFIPLGRSVQNASSTVAAAPTILSPAVVRSSVQELTTLDLHTRTGLIGRRDLDVTLTSLRLDEEEVNGYIDIYAVCRVLERGAPKFVDLPEMGRDSLFTLSASWVS